MPGPSAGSSRRGAILGAVLTAGYAGAIGSAIAASPHREQTDGVQAELTKSFSSAVDTAQRYPEYQSQIVAPAKTSFLQGDDWAYLAGIVAILLGAALVFFLFPRKDREKALLAHYHDEDARDSAEHVAAPNQASVGRRRVAGTVPSP